MIVFLKSLGSRVAKAITKPFLVPNGNEDTWSDITFKEFEANVKAHYALLQALNDDDISSVINCKSAYEIWNNLVATHEGTSQVKGAKIDLLRSQYENFNMNNNETIDNGQKVRKVIRALPQSWEIKSATLKELNDKGEMDFMGLIGNLKTHEMEKK